MHTVATPPTSVRRDAAFVALALAGLVVGGLVEHFDGPVVLQWIGYGAAYGFGGWQGLRAGLAELTERHIDIDLLMVLAALGALAIGAPFEGGMLLFLFSLSNVLQDVALGRSRRAIEALMHLRPDEARVRRNGAVVTLPLAQVAVGDVYVLRPGDRLPLDGIVVDGASAIDQATLTGESMPVDKTPGDEVFAGTINTTGALDVRVTKPSHETALARMIRLVEDAQSEKAQTQRLIDRYEQPYALGVLGLTALAIVVPWGLGEAFTDAFYRAMTLMVAASPCALVISTPAAVLSAIANGARRGVLFKGGVYVEATGSLRAIAFDKTGTLTVGAPRLVACAPLPGVPLTSDDLLRLAASVQQHAEHPLARATVAAATERALPLAPSTDFQAVIGHGVRACVDSQILHIANLRYFADLLGPTFDSLGRFAEAQTAVAAAEAAGQTGVVLATERDGTLDALGVLGYADTLRPEAARVLPALKRLGIQHTVMLTGDNATVSQQIGRVVGVDEVYAELLPERKVEWVRQFQARFGHVAMVGDGVNDAPALATASVGVAMGAAGSDVALETADLVLMSDDLEKLVYAIALSRAARRTLIANLGFAVGMIVVMIACILTIGLPLPLAVVGHEGSTVLVSLNGLRLLAFNYRLDG